MENLKDYVGMSRPVLDHGFVELVDYMGNDQRIVEAARVSYASNNVEKTDEENKKLIDYLLRNGHTSPFEQVVFTFHIKMPIFCQRQLIRHRMARVNEISGRYTKLNSEFFVPEHLRTQAKNNKQASNENEFVDDELEIIGRMAEEQDLVATNYDAYIEEGVSRELARINLPVSTYTEFYWQMDLSNLIKFMGLRSDKHAQKEIRLYSEAIEWFVERVTPFAYEAFENHVKYGTRLSKQEKELLSDLLADSLSEEKKEKYNKDENTKRTLRILLEKINT